MLLNLPTTQRLQNWIVWIGYKLKWNEKDREENAQPESIYIEAVSERKNACAATQVSANERNVWKYSNYHKNKLSRERKRTL